MQYPQYPFSGNHSPSGVPREGYSVLQNNRSVTEPQLNSPSELQGTGSVSQQPQETYQGNALNGETHNFSDQPATTWHWRSQQQNSQSALPIQEAPSVQHVPANSRSFAPPANLRQLQRVNRPQIQHHHRSDIYKSPIDRPYVGRRVESLNASSEINNGLDQENLTDQSEYYSVPQRDQVTEAKEFMQRDAFAETRSVESTQQEATGRSGKKLIVLRSQSPQERAEARSKPNSSTRSSEAPSNLPDAQLLTPNFESYVGSPVLDTSREAYQDATQWKVYPPKPTVLELPPAAVFESLPQVATQAPAVEYAPPAPTISGFRAAEKVAALPEPTPFKAPKVEEKSFQPAKTSFKAKDTFGVASRKPAPKPKMKEHSFQPGASSFKAKDTFSVTSPKPKRKSKAKENSFQPSASSFAAKDVFGSASAKVETKSKVIKKPMTTNIVKVTHRKDTSINKVSVPKVASANLHSTRPSYRGKRFETGGDIQAKTTAMTVAHPSPVAPPVASDSAWLSPWWMLVCFVPLAMYLLMGRGREVDDYSYEYDEIEDRPRLSPEMIERPGYSKSDAVYGETDEFFDADCCPEAQRRAIAAGIPMAAHVKTAGQSVDDIKNDLRSETVTKESVSTARFASSNSVQTTTELDSDASPNFRSQEYEEDRRESQDEDHREHHNEEHVEYYNEEYIEDHDEEYVEHHEEEDIESHGEEASEGEIPDWLQ